MTTPKILQQRQAQWGDPVYTHMRIARVWSGILDTTVTPHQVALCMAGMKLVRTSVNSSEEDSYKDAKGYVDIAGMVAAPSQEYLDMLEDLRGGPTKYMSREEFMEEAQPQALEEYMSEFDEEVQH